MAWQNPLGIFGTAEEAKRAAMHSAIADIDAALPNAAQAWKARAWDALEGDDKARAAALEAKAAYDALVERRTFAVAAAGELEGQIAQREARKHDKARRADRRALAAHLGNVRGAFERAVGLQAELQTEFDTLMGHAAKAFALIPQKVRGEIGYMLQIEEFRGLLLAAAVNIARDIASPSPLPDPTKPSRVDEFSDWRTGASRSVTAYVAQSIAGLKDAAFPEFASVKAGPAPSAAAVREEPADMAVVAPPAPDPSRYMGEVVDLRRSIVVASDDIGEEEEEGEEVVELVDEPHAMAPALAPEPAPLPLTAEREAELLANASI